MRIRFWAGQAPPLQKSGSDGEERKLAGTWHGDSLGISLAAVLILGVFAMAQTAEASERAGQAPPLQKRGSSGEEQKLAGTWRGDSLGRFADVPFAHAQGEQDKQGAPVQKRGSDGEERKLAGTWRGESLCVEKGDGDVKSQLQSRGLQNTACHDEVAVYRIADIPGKPGYVMVTGGKVVDGKEIVMGTGEGRYDSAKHTLTVELPRGVITLKADGDKLEGTFTLPDKTVLRRITLRKSE